MKAPTSNTSSININNLHPDYIVRAERVNHGSNKENEWVNVSPGCTKKENKNVSLVQELDTQYKTLLDKYEKLLESIEMSKECTSLTDLSSNFSRNLSNLRQNVTSSDKVNCNKHETKYSISSRKHEDSKSVVSNVAARDPEYKRLFKEIFTILNKVKTPQ